MYEKDCYLSSLFKSQSHKHHVDHHPIRGENEFGSGQRQGQARAYANKYSQLIGKSEKDIANEALGAGSSPGI